MGCNYYVVPNRPSRFSGYHIGKSSCGWLFAFQYQNETWDDPPVVWNSFDELKSWLYKYVVSDPQFVIVNEYDEMISVEKFLRIVEDKQNDSFCRDNQDNFRYSDNVGGYRFMHGEFS